MAFAETTKVPLVQSIAEIIGMIRRTGAESIGQFQDRDGFTIFFALGERRMKFTVPLVTEYLGPKRAGNGRAIDTAARLEQMNRQKGRALMLVIKAKQESIAVEYKSGRVQPLMLGGPK
jgi:hypothetical protein